MTVNEGGLWGAMQARGGVAAEYHGRPVVRHFGDPEGEYVAATTSVAVFDRSYRGRIVVRGREPGKMLNGILTGTIPGAATSGGEGVLGGRATYHAVLTPKGKMITDLWCVRLGDEGDEGYLLDVPIAGMPGLREHLRKLLPPRLASAEEVTGTTSMITVVGPAAAAAASRAALGLRVEVDDLEALEEGEWRVAGESVREGLLVERSGEVWPRAFVVRGKEGPVTALWTALSDAGVRPAGLDVWSTLRLEAGRPAFGTDMDEDTIPVEANIQDRAIDQTKGCYTGQEVIVRIRDRGHVNRHLCFLRLGDVPSPAGGTELFSAGDEPDKPVGRITSAVASPRFGETVALAYVRRGVETVILDGRAIAVPPL